MQDLFGFDITTRKRELNHIVTLNSIKHIYLPVLFKLILGAHLLNIRKFHFHNYSPMFIVTFMSRDLTCIESNDEKFPLVLADGVLQGDHLVQIF